MSEFRRKLLSISEGEIGEYIQDGLIFQLDGINKGPNSGMWTDLINGYTFSGNAIELSNGWDFNGSHYLESNESGISQLNENQNWTIEIAMHLKNPTSWGMLFSSNWNYSSRYKHFMVGYDCDTAYAILRSGCSKIHDKKYLYDYEIQFNSDITASLYCNKPNAVLNCNYINYSSNNRCELGGNGAELIIGARNSTKSAFIKAEIYAIRVYNRELSAEEMIYNQEIDKKRYNLDI